MGLAGWTQCAPAPAGDRLTLYAAVKSFSSNGVALTADFGLPAPSGTTPDAAIVATTLLADGTPGYAGADSGTSTTSGPAAFGLWYHSTDSSRLAASAAAQVRQSQSCLILYCIVSQQACRLARYRSSSCAPVVDAYAVSSCCIWRMLSVEHHELAIV